MFKLPFFFHSACHGLFFRSIHFYKHFSCFLLLFIICSCSVTSYVIRPEYKDKKIFGKELLIAETDTFVMEIEKISLLRESDSLKKMYLPVFNKQFENEIANFSTFSKVKTKKLKNPQILNEQEMPFPDGQKITLLIPKKNKLIYTIDDEIMDYVLIISKIKITSAWLGEPSEPYRSGFLQTVNYVIWDNFKSKAVCYGYSTSEHSFNFLNYKMIKSYSISKNAGFIISNSPFKK